MSEPMTGEGALGVAPGRVNLIGEHTDYNDGFVLPIALGARARVRAVPRRDDTVVVSSTQLGETVQLTDLSPTPGQWWGYVAGVVWVLRQRGHATGGVELHLDSRVPLGGGLSSSAAIEAASALALDALWGLGLDADALAEVAQATENDFLGIPTGPMDQRASLWCTAGHALLLDCRTLRGTQVPFALPDDLTLALVDTHSPHVLADGAYGERRAACARAAERLGVTALRDIDDLDAALGRLDDDVLVRRTRHVVGENARVWDAVAALEAADWPRFGALMTASHASMRDDYEITVPTVDQAVDSALASGALGARMTGGGFGGTVLALVPTGAMADFTRRVADDYAARGFDAPSVSTSVAEAGGLELRDAADA
ncbi:galactokinase [Propioniciclava soli]|uniref:Galactokinase n=1 Tax=Propioniciclava soli TaxID=2775081 RepID=A0ABZ3C3H6_9ACTN|nr:galactokinase [Propioniciclava soli]